MPKTATNTLFNGQENNHIRQFYTSPDQHCADCARLLPSPTPQQRAHAILDSMAHRIPAVPHSVLRSIQMQGKVEDTEHHHHIPCHHRNHHRVHVPHHSTHYRRTEPTPIHHSQLCLYRLDSIIRVSRSGKFHKAQH